MVGYDVGSAFDPMSNDSVRSGVGRVGSMVANVADTQLIVLAWNATMVQAKTLNCKLEVNLPCKHPFISSSQSRCSAIQSQLHTIQPSTHPSESYWSANVINIL